MIFQEWLKLSIFGLSTDYSKHKEQSTWMFWVILEVVLLCLRKIWKMWKSYFGKVKKKKGEMIEAF